MRVHLRVACFYIIVYLSTVELKIVDDYIRHYDELSYDTNDLHHRHLRAKRSLEDKSLSLKFKAHNREFHLNLKPSKSIFTRTYKSKHRNGTEDKTVDTSFIYDGVVVGKPGSHVHGAVILGIFRGTIRIPGETMYFIEPTYRFMGLKKSKALPYHSIIYKEEHIDKDPFRHKREAEKAQGSCAFDRVRDWMVQQTESEVNIRQKRSNIYHEEASHNKYSAESNKSPRSKRTTSGCSLGSQNTCILHMRSDPMLFNRFKEDLNGNEMAARDEIISFFASHVSELNHIYGNTQFTLLSSASSPCFSGVQFQIQQTTIMTDESEKCNTEEKTSFCKPNIDVSNFLNLNSLEDHDAFCLVYMFTYRDFSHGTLGLAWVGSPSASAGGICETYKKYTEGSSRVDKSLNTGIVTIINYNKRVAPRVSQLTFAHEVGHNFGSPHDDGSYCAPYGTSHSTASSGNYIMFASATQGNLPNNDDFSPCSKDNITRVLDAVVNAKSGKRNCFTGSDVAFCGNGIVEDGEECDCGFGKYCTDPCCIPRKSGTPTGNECTRQINPLTSRKYDCSPSQGPCCDSTCSFHTQASNTLCRARTDCMQPQVCNGTSAVCPPSVKEPNIITRCNSHSEVCIDGYCTGSLCQSIGYNRTRTETWEECFKTASGTLSVQQKEELCFLACRMKGNNGTCIASSDDLSSYEDFKAIVDEIQAVKSTSGGIRLPAGSPCNNYQGYCDVFHRCRGVDNDGPLQRLKNLIFSEKTLTDIKNWIIEHWWAVMLMAIGLILFMGLFIKFCAVHTPSSNPNAKPAQKLTDTLRRRRSRPPEQYRQPGPSGPPPPYSAHGGPPQGHRRKGGGKYKDLEMRKV